MAADLRAHALRAIVGSIVLLAPVACTQGPASPSRAKVSPTLAPLTPSGEVVVDMTGTGPKRLGHFKVVTAMGNLFAQGSCVGTGQVTVRLRTDAGEPFEIGATCLTAEEGGSLSASNTVDRLKPGGGVGIDVLASAHTRWHIAVSIATG